MKGDFSRQTFDPSRHYAAVLQQQGRVQLDADWNEQQLLALDRDETTARDVIGLTGAPRVEPGFRVTATGAGVTISRGHFYVDGILCENERDAMPITEQPDLPGFVLPNADGVYLVYLEAWQRHESAVEQPDLREKALGGADTATRLRTVAQVRMLPLDGTGAGATCSGALPEWDALLARRAPSPATAGRLRARTAAEAVTSDPACVLPPSAGFTGLENQLYRVEIHTGGDRTTARFKWSRENGSVVTPITGIAGMVLTVETTGRDDKLSFATNQWGEVIDDALDLDRQSGALLRVGPVDAANRTITMLGAGLPALDATRHRVLRRWEQRNPEANEQGVPLALADWITLEDGIQVHFEDGTYKPGDFWCIPARSSVSVETGTIEWPSEGGQPAALPSQGNRHHFARLAILRRQAGVWAALSTATEDCRRVFPPLTGITADDVSFNNRTCDFSPAATTVQAALDELCRTASCQCTILIRPGDNIAAAFEKLGPNHDAMVCFQAGDYRVPEPIVVRRRGNLRITGCGPATRLFGTRDECVLRFENCASVSVEHMQIDGGPSRRRQLNGALMFVDCPSVSVEHCAVVTRGFGSRQTACITVRNTAGPSAAATIARIVACNLSVGHLQVGLLLLNVGHTFVHDNVVRAGDRPATVRLLEDLDYRARIRRNLLTNVVFGPLAAGASPTNATVTLFGRAVHFRTIPGLTTSNRNENVWQRVVARVGAGEIGGPHAVFRRLEEFADRALLDLPAPEIPTALRKIAREILLQDQQPTGSQGIVVGGTVAEDVRILNNTVESFLAGIHIGVSHEAPFNTPPDTAGTLVISQNTIRVRIASAATRERHGVFVGNFRSLQVAENTITADRSSMATTLQTDGIRVYGHAGARMSIRDNHLERFDIGIHFVTEVLPRPSLWVITQNLAVNASEVVRAQRRRGRVFTSIRGQIRGVDQNAP